MQLTGEEIRKRNLVPNSPIRRASADLTVGHILVGDKKHTDSVSIEPQQMFIIVSRERVSVPVGLAANALPKTGLCNEGILCINTGIIDTGYSGLISTTAINFGKTAYLISPGDVFLRVVFHPLDGDKAHASLDDIKPVGDDEYIRLRRSYSIKFPAQFMDVPGQVDRITDKVLARHTGDLVKFVGVVTLIYALWNIGAYVLLQRQAAAPSVAQRVDVAAKSTIDSLRAELANLRTTVDSLGRARSEPAEAAVRSCQRQEYRQAARLNRVYSEDGYVMTPSPTYVSLDDAFAATVRSLLDRGDTVAPRGSETRELLCVEFRLDMPRARRITIPARRWNEALAVGELCWHMAAADDVESLAYYAEPWRQFSEDGQHILGSCYGRKIFDAHGSRGSQWDRAKSLLIGDPETRRAVLTLGDDAEHERWRDVACLREVQFILRRDKLHCVATMRSNDVIWGLGYDVFFVTMLQERMAAEIGVDIGWYLHRANSMHLYRRHYGLAEEIVASPPTEPQAMSPMERPEQIPEFLSVERALRLNEPIARGSLATYWQELSVPLARFAAAKHTPRSDTPLMNPR